MDKPLRFAEKTARVSYEAGLIMIFGILENGDLNGESSADHLHGLQTAIQKLAKQVEKTCIDSARMICVLVEFGIQRETWDTRSEYFKKKEMKCL